MIELHYSNGSPVDVDETLIAKVESSGDGETTRLTMINRLGNDKFEIYVTETPQEVGKKMVDAHFNLKGVQ